MQLTPDMIQDLATIAFCLEPLSDKPGCTTRFIDLPNKPLTDFIIAGINAGKYFRFLAEDVLHGKDPDVFFYHPRALEHVNRFKSSKTVNFGLLEIMFPAVYARLTCDRKEDIINTIIELIHRDRPSEVLHLRDARVIAWKTSENREKQVFTGTEFVHIRSVQGLYEAFYTTYGPENSSYQWAEQFKTGLPIISKALYYLDILPQNTALETVFRETTISTPQLKLGIIADMCAAALFLHLSFAE